MLFKGIFWFKINILQQLFVLRSLINGVLLCSHAAQGDWPVLTEFLMGLDGDQMTPYTTSPHLSDQTFNLLTSTLHLSLNETPSPSPSAGTAQGSDLQSAVLSEC